MTSILERDSGAADASPQTVLVAGANGGIGAALCHALLERYPHITLVRQARSLTRLPRLPADTFDIEADITSETSIREAVSSLPDGVVPDWVLVATGWLHDKSHSPEKTFRALDADHLLQAYRVNAVGPALLIKHLLPRMDLSRPCRIGVLSARVGSISDNRLGGWYAYRASKAALNMLIKNYAIELARKSDRCIIVGLQPGTTDTRLSAPFQRNVPAGQLQSPQFTASHLVEVMTRLLPTDSGGLFDFLGLPFDP